MRAPADTSVGAARRLMEGFGLALKSARAHHQVTLRVLAENIGIHPSDLTRIERALAIPTPEQEQILRQWLLQHPVSDEQGSS